MGPNQIAGIVQGGIGLTAALGGAIYGGVKSGKYNQHADYIDYERSKENENWYNIKRAQEYTRRSDVQAMINTQRQLLQEQDRRNRAINAVAGGTDASLAAGRQAAAQSLASTMSDAASQASEYNDSIERQYRMQKEAIQHQKQQNLRQRAAATAQAASQVVNAGLEMVNDSFDTFTSSPVKSNA